MLVGVPKEIKVQEYRVGLVPGSVRELVHHGHKVLVETNAGVGIGFDPPRFLRPGDVVEMSITGLGTLRNSFR